VKASTFPHQLPFDASQLAVGLGVEDLLVAVGAMGVDMGILVVVRVDVGVEVGMEVGLDVGTDVEIDVRVEDGRTEDEVGDEPLKERYQFERSVSPRHSPTVTPFHPFCWIRSK